MMVMPEAYNFSNPPVNNFKFLTSDNQGYKLVFMNMADRIKQRMQELEMTQDDLARQANLTQPAIFKLLSGKTQRTTRLAEIAKALKVRPEWLATGEGAMQEVRNIQIRYEKAPEGVRGAIDKLLRYEQESADVERAVKVIDALIPDPPSRAGH